MKRIKPSIIYKIEKSLRISLKETSLENITKIGFRNTYSVDNHKNVIGLNLQNNGLIDITFLNDFKNIKVLDLRTNKIKNINILGDLVALEIILLNYNNIRTARIINWGSLKAITLSHNSINAIYIYDCQKLEKLTFTTFEQKSF